MQVQCLNEAIQGTCKEVFKPWSKRLEPSDPPLESNENDPELLLHVPFSGDVRIRAISVIGGTDGTAPAELKVFINREDLDFSTAAEVPPAQVSCKQP